MATASQDTVQLLGRGPGFSALGENELGKVAEVATARRVEAGVPGRPEPAHIP